MADLVVMAAVKEHFDDQNGASDFYDALNKAAQRATDNDRKTIQPKDL